MLGAAEILATPPAHSTQHPAPMLAATEIAEAANLIPIDFREDPYRVNIPNAGHDVRAKTEA